MTGIGANVLIHTWLARSLKVDGFRSSRLQELGMVQHIVGIRDIIQAHASDAQFQGRFSDLISRIWHHDQAVMGHVILIAEDPPDLATSFDGHVFDAVLQAGLSAEPHGQVDPFGPTGGYGQLSPGQVLAYQLSRLGRRHGLRLICLWFIGGGEIPALIHRRRMMLMGRRCRSGSGRNL